MKTPKFRAFVKKENRICEVKMLDFESEHITTTLEDGRQFVNYDFTDIELMQSTGFRDKNGKELFEGDIIQKPFYVDYDNYCQSKKYIGQVVYVDSSGCFSIKADNGIFYHLWELLEFSKDMDYIEVIGNIYENPELLQVEQNTEVENTMKNKDLELLKKLIYDNCYLKTNGGSVNEGIDNVIEYLNDFPFTVTLIPHRVGNLKCKSQNCNTCPVRSICAIKGVNPELTFYENLEEYKTYEAKLFDRDLYDLIKVRLDKEVVD